MKEILCLSQEDVRASGATDMKVAVPLIEETLRLALKGETLIAQESALRCFPGGGDEAVYSLPAFIGGEEPMAGLKWTAHGPAANAARGLPHICALDILNDPETGIPLAVMDGGLIGAVRTAAVTAVALKHLSPRETERVVLCGTGTQARQQLKAVAFRFPNAHVEIWGRTPERAIHLAERARRELGLDARPAENVQTAASAADVVISATSAAEPYLTEKHFGENCLYCHIGLNDIAPGAIAAFDTFVADAWEEAKNCSGQSLFRAYRAGTFVESSLTGLLGEYVTGRKRISGKGRIFFDAFGLPVFDIALARHAWRHAVNRGMGKKVPIWYDDYGTDL